MTNMSGNKLIWIENVNFQKAIDKLASRVNKSITESSEKMKKNIIDPFSSILIASSMNLSTKDNLVSMQMNSATLSSISSALGKFHQNILSSVEGWCNHDKEQA